MSVNTAVIHLKNAAAPSEKPLMLRELLFCPVLTWVCQELSARGVERFFVVCDESWQEEASAAAADVNAQVVTSWEAVDGEVLVLPSPVLPVAAFGASPVYVADASNIKDPAVRPEKSREADLSFMPIRSETELMRAMPLCRDGIVQRHIAAGVTVIDPTNTYIDPRCVIGEGVTILPGTILCDKTVIGRGCELGPNTMIRDCTVGEYTTVNASQLNESRVGDHTTVGPFTYVRPKCVIGDHCRVGDFVEVKNSVIGNGTKVSHLTYVGDSDVGEKVNFGCGTVTTNYDGNRKFRCTIGDNVFLGCNTNLVAPVTLGDGVYTAAGSTVTEDVPADALAIARAKQTNKPGWAAEFRKTWKKK